MHRMYPYPYWFRAQFVPVWATTTQEALELMRNAVQGERNDELFMINSSNLLPTKIKLT